MVSITHTQGFGSPVSRISDGFIVLDVEKELRHLIFVHRVDYRPGIRSSIGKVVKFSKWCYAPCRTQKLRIATPSYFRDKESLPQGIGDRYDSTLKKDASPWMRQRFSNNGIDAEVTFSSSSDPWVYCTSHIPSSRSFRDLSAKFSDEYGYDATTQIKDVESFAMWLGIDFALQLDKSTHVKIDTLGIVHDLLVRRAKDMWRWQGGGGLETLVHVYHGPVHYEDESGVVSTDEDMVDIHGSVRAWFTKRTEFADQSEYRFVVTTLGTPCNEIHEIHVSEELRQLTLAI